MRWQTNKLPTVTPTLLEAENLALPLMKLTKARQFIARMAEVSHQTEHRSTYALSQRVRTSNLY